MLLKKFELGPLMNNCYILGDDQEQRYYVIDAPIESFDAIQGYIDAQRLTQWKMEAVLLTHGHWDHIYEAHRFHSALGVPVYIHEQDADIVEKPPQDFYSFPIRIPPLNDRVLYDPTQPLVCGSIHLELLETPGHTPGGICFLDRSNKILFSGDTLFRESIGRWDLPEGNGKVLLHSLHTKLLDLPDDIQVYAGHGLDSTMGHEKEFNPFLKGGMENSALLDMM